MFRRLHKDKKPCKMDDTRHIGISKLDFAFGSVLGVHFGGIWLLAVSRRKPTAIHLHFRKIRYILVSTPRLTVNAPMSVSWIYHEIEFFSAVIGVSGSATTRRSASEFL